MQVKHFPNWKDQVFYTPEGPDPLVLEENDRMKVILAGLEAGQSIPVHPENMAVYHFLEGEGLMLVDGQRYEIAAGSTVLAPQGAERGLEARTALAFLAARIS